MRVGGDDFRDDKKRGRSSNCGGAVLGFALSCALLAT